MNTLYVCITLWALCVLGLVYLAYHIAKFRTDHWRNVAKRRQNLLYTYADEVQREGYIRLAKQMKEEAEKE